MRFAADANILLSAVLGGWAKEILDHSAVTEILTTSVTSEVEEYAADLAQRKGVPLDVVLRALATLPVTVVDPSLYSDSIPEAKRKICPGDMTDVDLSALALH